MIANSDYETKNDDTPTKETEIYTVLTMVCVNPKCNSFCGPDLNKPIKVAETVRNKIK